MIAAAVKTKAAVVAAEAAASERSLWCPGATERTYWKEIFFAGTHR